VTRWEALLLHVANLLVGGTGLVYAWMRYFASPEDPFALANHPLQPTFQHLHVLFAPLLVFTGGLIWQRHVVTRMRTHAPAKRRTGLTLALTLLPMTVSGYLIQTVADETWREVWIFVHLAASGLWIAGYAVHLLFGKKGAPVAGVEGLSSPDGTPKRAA